METKKCNKCGEIKNKADFFKSSRNKDGCRSHCKICENKSNLARQSKYKRTEYYQSGNYKEIKRKYYKQNKEKILSENAAWRQTFKGRLLAYKKAAIKRNVEWLLSDEDFKSFWQQPCSYCGDKIETIGIDRVNNNEGYHLANCVSCCSTCNTMKMTLSKEEFVNKITKILIYLKND